MPIVHNETDLEGLASLYGILLADCSVLMGDFFVGECPLINNLRGSITFLRKEMENRRRIIHFLENGGELYVTPRVFEEYESFTFKPVLRHSNLELRNVYRRNENSRRRLFRLIKSRDRVLNLDEDEREAYNFYFDFYVHKLLKGKLSRTDYDLLITGLVVSQTRTTEGGTAIISNDTYLVRPWKFLKKSEELEEGNFGFFFREKTDLFTSPRFYIPDKVYEESVAAGK